MARLKTLAKEKFVDAVHHALIGLNHLPDVLNVASMFFSDNWKYNKDLRLVLLDVLSKILWDPELRPRATARLEKLSRIIMPLGKS